MLSLTNMIRAASILGILVLCALYAAPLVYAAQFQPMVGVPGLDTSGNYTFVGLINRLYIFLIAIGAVIGVIKIAFAGVKWATSASGGSISAAKEDIKGVLLGLVILMVPYIVLSIINPQFASLDVLNLDPLNLPQSKEPGTSATDGGGQKVNCSACTTTKGNEKKCDTYVKDCKGTITSATKDQSVAFVCNIFINGQCPSGSTNPTVAFTATCASTCLDDSGNGKCNWLINECDAIPGKLTKKTEVVGRDGEGGSKTAIRYGCMVAPENGAKCPVGQDEDLNEIRACTSCIALSEENINSCDGYASYCNEKKGKLETKSYDDWDWDSEADGLEYICSLPRKVACPANE